MDIEAVNTTLKLLDIEANQWAFLPDVKMINLASDGNLILGRNKTMVNFTFVESDDEDDCYLKVKNYVPTYVSAFVCNRTAIVDGNSLLGFTITSSNWRNWKLSNGVNGKSIGKAEVGDYIAAYRKIESGVPTYMSKISSITKTSNGYKYELESAGEDYDELETSHMDAGLLLIKASYFDNEDNVVGIDYYEPSAFFIANEETTNAADHYIDHTAIFGLEFYRIRTCKIR